MNKRDFSSQNVLFWGYFDLPWGYFDQLWGNFDIKEAPYYIYTTDIYIKVAPWNFSARIRWGLLWSGLI